MISKQESMVGGGVDDPLYVYLDNDIDMNDLCDAQGHPKQFPSDTAEKDYCYFNGGGHIVRNVYFFNTSSNFVLIRKYKDYGNVVFKDILVVSSEPFLIYWNVYNTYGVHRIHDVEFYGGVYSTGNAEVISAISGQGYDGGNSVVGPNIVFSGVLYASGSCAFLSQRSNAWYGNVTFQQCGFIGRIVSGGSCIFIWRRGSEREGYSNHCFCILKSATNFTISYNEATRNRCIMKNFYLVASNIVSKTIIQQVNWFEVSNSCYDASLLEDDEITFDGSDLIAETTEHMKDSNYMADTYGFPS